MDDLTAAEAAIARIRGATVRARTRWDGYDAEQVIDFLDEMIARARAVASPSRIARVSGPGCAPAIACRRDALLREFGV